MATGCKTIDYPKLLTVRVAETHQEAARKKAKALGYESISELVRAFLEAPSPTIEAPKARA